MSTCFPKTVNWGKTTTLANVLIVDQPLVKAGVRLAKLLNEALQKQ
jgi:hypothetical protein